MVNRPSWSRKCNRTLNWFNNNGQPSYPVKSITTTPTPSRWSRRMASSLKGVSKTSRTQVLCVTAAKISASNLLSVGVNPLRFVPNKNARVIVEVAASRLGVTGALGTRYAAISVEQALLSLVICHCQTASLCTSILCSHFSCFQVSSFGDHMSCIFWLWKTYKKHSTTYKRGDCRAVNSQMNKLLFYDLLYC